MRYIHFFGNAPICGTDYHYLGTYPDSTSDDQLNQISAEYCEENAESYEYLATGWDEGWESEENEDAYYADAEGYWEEVSKEQYKELQENYG